MRPNLCSIPVSGKPVDNPVFGGVYFSFASENIETEKLKEQFALLVLLTGDL